MRRFPAAPPHNMPPAAALRSLRPCSALAHLAALLPCLALADRGADVATKATQDQWTCLKAQPLDFVVVRAWRSIGAFDENAPANVKTAAEAGFDAKRIDLYMFPDTRPHRELTLEEQVEGLYTSVQSTSMEFSGVVWLDVEPLKGHWTLDHEGNYKDVQVLVDALEVKGFTVGIYSSHWAWTSICGTLSGFQRLPLWYARYQTPPDPSFSGFQPFGGWTSAAMKQYAGNAKLCGLSLDLNSTP